MTDIWQNNALNPSNFPKDKKIAIGLPTLALQGSHSGNLTYNDLFRNDNGQQYIDFDQIISKLDDRNTFKYRQRLETLTLGLRLPFAPKTAIQVGHAVRLNSQFEYSKALPSLLWNGNAQYINTVADIAIQGKYFDWHEFGVGISHDFGKVQIGAKVKYLTGISSFVTDPNANIANVFTSGDIYQLSITTDYGISTTGIISAIDTSNLGFDVVLNQLKSGVYTKNSGRSFDLGISAQLTDRLQVQASLLDLGGTITWNNNSAYFKSKGVYTFEGIVIPGADLINGADSLSFDLKLDTLNDIFKFVRTNTSYTSRIPVVSYLAGQYAITKRLLVGLAVRTEFDGDFAATSVGISARFSPVKQLSLGGMYSVNDRSAANLGFLICVKPGPLQIFFASDNILNAFTPRQTAVLNLRSGVSLVF